MIDVAKDVVMLTGAPMDRSYYATNIADTEHGYVRRSVNVSAKNLSHVVIGVS